jgi:hypothetical protein
VALGGSGAKESGMNEPMKAMTLRDYFAAAAITGLIQHWAPHAAVEKAYEVADMMLKEHHEEGTI